MKTINNQQIFETLKSIEKLPLKSFNQNAVFNAEKGIDEPRLNITLENKYSLNISLLNLVVAKMKELFELQNVYSTIDKKNDLFFINISLTEKPKADEKQD